MKRIPLYLIIVVFVLVGTIGSFYLFSKKPTVTGSKSSAGDCTQFSNKDGYTGCMSLVIGKEKKCKFKIDNKINESTQQMEFTYTCSPK